MEEVKAKQTELEEEARRKELEAIKVEATIKVRGNGTIYVAGITTLNGDIFFMICS